MAENSHTVHHGLVLAPRSTNRTGLAVYSRDTWKTYYLGDFFLCAKMESSIIIHFLRELPWDDKEKLLS